VTISASVPTEGMLSMMSNGGAFVVEDDEATKARQKSPPMGSETSS
jgi:hypothetical protein